MSWRETAEYRLRREEKYYGIIFTSERNQVCLLMTFTPLVIFRYFYVALQNTFDGSFKKYIFKVCLSKNNGNM